MSTPRIDMDRLQELVRLHRMGTGAREEARLLRMGPNTERDYPDALEAAGLLDGSIDDLPELAVLKEARARTSTLAPRGFNGAVDRHRRRRGHGRSMRDSRSASMGPSIIIDGDGMSS